MRKRRTISIIVIMALIVSMMGVMPFAKVVKPAKVTGLKATTNAKYTITFKWKKAARATHYRLYIKEGNGKYKLGCQTKNLKEKLVGFTPGTKVSFKVRAYNGTKAGKISAVKSIRTYSKVKFVMKDKTVTKAVKYGANAVAPVVSDYKSGSTTYTFDKWDKSLNAIKGNTTITAIYNTVPYYTVRFVMKDKTVAKKVKKGGTVTTPTPNDIQESDNVWYEFSKWDKTFSNISSNLTVTALYDKYEWKISEQQRTFDKKECVNYINQERTRAGLTLVSCDQMLCNICEAKAKAVYEALQNGAIEDSLHYIGGGPDEWLSNYGYSKQFPAGEIIYVTGTPAISYSKVYKNGVVDQDYTIYPTATLEKEAMDAWMASTGHRKQILLKSYQKVGVGEYKGVALAIFVYK